MGATATSLHFLASPVDYRLRLSEDIEKAYRKLGYARPKQANESVAKRVILAADSSGDWLSLYDSENEQIDTGELKQLAVEITRKLGTVALLTSVYDSDSFEFVMFHNGKQVDAAVSDPEGHAGGLKMLKGKRRAQAWHSMFIARDLPRAVLSGRPGQLLQAWEQRLKDPPSPSSPFAEDELGAWCALAGLAPENATTIFRDLTERGDQTGLTMLAFERVAPKSPKTAPSAPGAALAYYRSDDDCPYLRFFPAPWPRHPGASAKEQWAIVGNGGISGLRLRLGVEGPAPVQLERIFLRALPFYNGQVTSLTSIAEHEWTAPDPGAACPSELSVDIPDFFVPSADPQSRRQVILILIVQATLPQEGEATLIPSIETMDGVQPSPALPPLRLRALRPSWIPLVSRSETPNTARNEAVLRLNTPSLWSATAIVPADRGDARAQARRLAEMWFALLSPEAGTMAVVHTKKHMSASFNISKATKILPFAELTRDKLWTRLFDEETDYQTITIGLARPDSPHAHAGVTIQASLRGFGAILGASTLSCALWLIDHEQIHRRIGGSPEAAAEIFEAWIGAIEPSQAWIARAAWIPEFTTYDDFMQTPYESAVSPDWSGADGPPRQPWLRFVAEKLWLDESFLAPLDPRRIEAVAENVRRGRVTALSLRPGRSLFELEQALAPILPRFSGRQLPKE